MRLTTVCFALVVIGAMGCGPEEQATTGFDDQTIITDFADHVVVPTYELLATRVHALKTAVDALAADPSQDNLVAAQTAWVAARKPWEQSEGFLFGPVDSFGYDPAMDSWPVNHTDLDAVLASGAGFTAEYVGNLQETQKGFHTIEYLLFGVERAKTAADLTPRELEYTVAIAGELATVAHALAASWTEGVNGQKPYRDVFTTAGAQGNTAYPSLTAAAQEILGGMIGICDEVANGKIADPYDAHDPTLVESQFSFNSITDFQDNIRSVQNAYLGAVPEASSSGAGLSNYVAKHDAALDTRVKSEIEAAIAAIGAIPGPFRTAITTPSSYEAIEGAQAAVRKLQTSLERDVHALVVR